VTDIPTPTVYEAVEVLFLHRHSLPADVLRSMQSIYLCASAAQYGEPYERGWLDEEEIASHDLSECETDNPKENQL